MIFPKATHSIYEGWDLNQTEPSTFPYLTAKLHTPPTKKYKEGPFQPWNTCNKGCAPCSSAVPGQVAADSGYLMNMLSDAKVHEWKTKLT